MTQHHVTRPGESVLEELELDPVFAAKAKLALRIQRSIAEMGLTQREAASQMPITQPKLSAVTRGRLEDISLTKLEECLRALGHDIEIAVGVRRSGEGELRVREVAESDRGAELSTAGG